MDAIAGYGSEDDAPLPMALLSPPSSIISAPTALTVQSSSRDLRLKAIDSKTNSLTVNRRADVVLAPVQGPTNPFKQNASIQGVQRVGVGAIEAMSMEDWCFNEQYHTYQKSGYAVDHSTNAVLGNYQEYLANEGNAASYRKRSTGELSSRNGRALIESLAEKSSEKRKRDEFSAESLADDSSGPWANVETPKDSYQLALEAFKAGSNQPAPTVSAVVRAEPQAEEPEETAPKNPRLHIVEPEADDEVWEKKNERKMGFVLPPRPARGATIAEVSVS